MGTRIADAIPDIKYLLEQINIIARTWHTAIDPKNTSCLTISGEYQKHFCFTWQGCFTQNCIMCSLQNISPLNHYINYIILIGLVSRK